MQIIQSKNSFLDCFFPDGMILDHRIRTKNLWRMRIIDSIKHFEISVAL